jgi:hypothetical protein
VKAAILTIGDALGSFLDRYPNALVVVSALIVLAALAALLTR